MGSHYAILTDPPADSPIKHGAEWIISAITGQVATSVACLAVAAIGFQMLSGRIELKRGVTVVIGCLILFGARSVASALVGYAPVQDTMKPPAASDFQRSRLKPIAPAQPNYDPYAGASVPVQ